MFKDISVIKKVYLPESLTAIYKQAFMNTNIENIYFSNNMIYFGEEAFKNCKFLKEIKINKSMRYIKSNVFVGCKKDLKIRIFDEIITFPYKFNLTDNLANRFNLKENNIRAKTKSMRVNDTIKKLLA